VRDPRRTASYAFFTAPWRCELTIIRGAGAQPELPAGAASQRAADIAKAQG
jgi:hypothetical protein